MGHDYANKYANYWSKKNKTIKSGKANFKDSGKQKTYNAEFGAIRDWNRKYPNSNKFKKLNWKQSEKYFKKIAKSATYQKLCENQIGSNGGKKNPTLPESKLSWCNCWSSDLVWCNAIKRNQLSIYNRS